MPEYVVTVIKTREEKYLVAASGEAHARLLAMRGDGELLDTHHWVDAIDEVLPANRHVEVAERGSKPWNS